MNLRRVFHPQPVMSLLSVAVVLMLANITLSESWVTVLAVILAMPALCAVLLMVTRRLRWPEHRGFEVITSQKDQQGP
jgi:hypothetical protein